MCLYIFLLLTFRICTLFIPHLIDLLVHFSLKIYVYCFILFGFIRYANFIIQKNCICEFLYWDLGLNPVAVIYLPHMKKIIPKKHDLSKKKKISITRRCKTKFLSRLTASPLNTRKLKFWSNFMHLGAPHTQNFDNIFFSISSHTNA
jgi:hypothetical protein